MKTSTNSAASSTTNSLSPELLAGIRRRKLLDTLFSALGLSLVMGSLLILLILFGQLVYTGGSRIFHGHLVKSDGFSPRNAEVVGKLHYNAKAEPDQSWMLQQEPYYIANALDILTADQLSELSKSVVKVEADMPVYGVSDLEASAIEAAGQETPTKFSRTSTFGQLKLTKSRWQFTPLPIPIVGSDEDLTKLLTPSLDGKDVSIGVGLAKSLPLKFKTLDTLEYQNFFQSMPSSKSREAGIKSAWVGSILVVGVTMLLAIPLGVAAGVWLEEYAKKNWLTAIIEINIANLAGVPSIVWGLMALGIFVYYLNLGRSILTAGLTLGLLVLPIVIMATREAIRTIPIHIREASYACGATKWQTVRFHVLPYSLGGILTGTIIGLSRAIGETAPLITIGAFTFVAFLPEFNWQNPLGWLMSGFTVLPIQIFNWVSRPEEGFQENAAAAGIVLLGLTLSMNAAAIYFRNRLRKRIKW